MCDVFACRIPIMNINHRLRRLTAAEVILMLRSKQARVELVLRDHTRPIVRLLLPEPQNAPSGPSFWRIKKFVWPEKVYTAEARRPIGLERRRGRAKTEILTVQSARRIGLERTRGRAKTEILTFQSARRIGLERTRGGRAKTEIVTFQSARRIGLERTKGRA